MSELTIQQKLKHRAKEISNDDFDLTEQEAFQRAWSELYDSMAEETGGGVLRFFEPMQELKSLQHCFQELSELTPLASKRALPKYLADRLTEVEKALSGYRESHSFSVQRRQQNPF